MTDDREQPEIDARWEQIARYLAGESDPDEQRGIREELDRDADRAALLNALDASLAQPIQTPLSPREVEAALASVMARRGASAAAVESSPDVIPLRPRGSVQLAALRSRLRSSGIRAAAAVLVVAGASMLWRATRPVEGGAPDTRAVSAARVHRTTAGEIDTLQLTDGSTVVLGPGSTLAIGAFGASIRETTLDGQAYFDVVHDDARPFVVRTSSATLRDVGTSFSVLSGDAGRGTRVAVTSGAVDVVAAGGVAGTPTVLHAGDRAEVMEGRMRVERGAVTPNELSWTRGVLELRDAPLVMVAEELRRWYGVKLVVTDSSIADRRVTATFQDASADELGRVLAAVLATRVTRNGDTLHVGAPAGR
jgi:transmembrane sensor